MSRAGQALKLLPADGPSHEPADTLVASYRRLADVFHDVLAEQSLDALLERIADTLAELIPHDTLTIYELDAARSVLVPMLARDEWAENILNSTVGVGEGITGWAAEQRQAVLTNQAHLDPRVVFVPGTPADEPEALISVPLIARGAVKGALNVYRLGASAAFDEQEFELAQRFGDAAALALDNAQIRARLEHQAQTDSLTGLYNHRYFHERLREELRAASRAHASVAVVMLDIDDFKRINDVWGHGTGDEVLRTLADTLRATVRGSDVVCRLGGEEFGVIVPSCDDESAAALAARVADAVREHELDPVGRITISAGLAQGPQHAMNPRELIACAEAAMMTAKARGKDRVVLFGESDHERPGGAYDTTRDVRSIAHLKMLQSLSGKLTRLNGVREIGTVIANELRALIDYHNCRVFILEGEDVIPVAFRGEFSGTAEASPEVLRCKVGEGITGRVAATGESLLVGDAARCEYGRRLPGTDEIEESQVVVPLLYGSRVIGVVGISKLGLEQFDDDDVRLLEVLAGHASVALENARLYERERREAETARALLELSRELASVTGLEGVLERVVERAASILDAETTSIWLQDGGELVARAAWSGGEARAARVVGTALPLERVRPFLTTTEPFVADPKLVEQLGVPEDRCLLVAPLGGEETEGGCIAALLPAGLEPSERAQRLLAGIAFQAKLAIANAGSFESLEDTFLSTVEALANALEANDEYTSSHARSITDTAIEVGVEIGLDAAALKRLELGALFHDIGKIGIPSAILSKPGPLTSEERLVMETHPELGERIISPIERLQEVRPIVRHCHEHFDGTGYPDRKSGGEIPIESRIILVCDAFHAMTTDRPYRKRLPVEEARRRLRSAAGTQFDAIVVDAYLRLLDLARPDGRAA